MNAITVKVTPDLSAFRGAEQREVAGVIRGYLGDRVMDEDVYGLADALLEKFTILPL